MSLTNIPFFTNLQCESAMPWAELTDQLETGLKRFSNGEIEQPVRATLLVKEHSGFLGKLNFKIFCQKPFSHYVMLSFRPFLNHYTY